MVIGILFFPQYLLFSIDTRYRQQELKNILFSYTKLK